MVTQNIQSVFSMDINEDIQTCMYLMLSRKDKQLLIYYQTYSG